MAKINPWAMKRPNRAVETKTFTDPRYPESPVTLTLRMVDPCERTLAHEKADELTTEYVTGENGREPNTYPSPDGQPVRLSFRIIYNACLLEVMQVCADEDRYEFTDFIGLAVTMPSVWDRIMAWTAEIGEKSEEVAALGNASRGATTETPSG